MREQFKCVDGEKKGQEGRRTSFYAQKTSKGRQNAQKRPQVIPEAFRSNGRGRTEALTPDQTSSGLIHSILLLPELDHFSLQVANKERATTGSFGIVEIMNKE